MQAIFLLFTLLLAAHAKYAYNVVKFSTERGYFNASFQLTLSVPNSLSGFPCQINYTIATNEAALSNGARNMRTGTVFTAPLTISRTTVVNAILWNSTFTGNLTTHTYVFPADVPSQPRNYQTLGDIGVTQSLAIQGLTTIPSISVTSDAPYPTCVQKACRKSNTPCMVEWFQPDSKDNFMAPAEYDLYGASSITYTKKNYRIAFKDNGGGDGGDGTLDFPLFQGFDDGFQAVRTFKELNLRAHSQDSIWGARFNLQLWMKNIFQDWTFDDMEALAPHARYVHFYYNWQYTGMYHLREQLSDHWFRAYFGGGNDDYEIVNKEVLSDDTLPQTSTFLSKMKNNMTYANLNNYLDWNAFMPYVLMQHYTGNIDLGYHNWIMGGQVKPKPWNGKNGGWKFFPSDNDLSFLHRDAESYDYNPVSYDCGGFPDVCTNILDLATLSSLNIALQNERHPDWLIMMRDWHYKMFVKESAPFSDVHVAGRFQRIMDTFQMNLTMQAEIMRWGYQPEWFSYKGSSNYYQYPHWKSNVDYLFKSWIPQRLAILTRQYSGQQWISPVGGVSFSLTDRQIVRAGSSLTITAINQGKADFLYYTTNGEDPRSPGGVVNANATKISVKSDVASISVLQPTLFTVRLFCSTCTGGDQWGPLDTLTVMAGTASDCTACGKLIITEVSYQPKKISGQELRNHFVEVRNIGQDPILLTGFKLTGINSYKFPPIFLPAGGFYVVGLYWEDFKLVYGKYPDDVQIATLGNKGDNFKLYDAFGNLLHDLKYQDRRPWSEFADGEGYTLVARPEFYNVIAKLGKNSDDEQARYWRYSAQIGGSPWADDPIVRPQTLKLQFRYLSFEKDWFELYNTDSKDIDISGWILAKSLSSDTLYTFPSGTIVVAKGVLRVESKLFGWKLSRGKDLALFETKFDSRNKSAVTGLFVEFIVAEHEMSFKKRDILVD